ncbi:MAG: hydantoinase/oxoprolinase family protein [Ectothiorhodospiraceae bacterium]|nr:hydantoinase/oxoprolinase family protein [Ectothiorhodospiraceae bacterium]
MLWVGVDVGGTFTDLVVYDDEAGTVRAGKTPSTPDDPGRGVLNGLRAMDVSLGAVRRFRHGATVATNTALERAGAELGVVTTAGFRDVLIVGRGNRLRLYDIKATRPPGLVRRSRVMEVAERLAADGSERIALDENAVRAAAERLRELRVEAVAVCFLHAYANPEHERRAAEIVRAVLPDVPVSWSADVLAEHREYERFATTALNAYVAPRVAGYLARLRDGLAAGGLRAAPEIMTSSGGSWSFERMARLPVNSMLSGPAGGVIGAVSLAERLGYRDLITYDMGGTSTDACLIRDGRYALATEGQVGGFPNRAPQIEISTVGAGGGSVAYLDVGGFLNVGPRSAGANPGPACYGRGGTEPTVTDANVVLGRFRPGEPLGGEIVIDVAAAEQAVGALAHRLGLDPMETAEGIVRIAVARMTGAIKEISVMRGIDPRAFTLLAYGGAGPLHAAAVAEELGIRTVLVPPLSGAFSAFGLLVADRRLDFSRTRVMPLAGASLDDVRAVLAPMREEAAAELAAEGFPAERIRFEAAVDMRYVGQAFELTTPLADDARDVADLVAAFHRVYEERYAHADDGPVEAVSFRLSAYGLTEKPGLPSPAGRALDAARRGSRPVRFAGEMRETPVYRREDLPATARIEGPAIVEEAGSATVVPPGARCVRHPSGALVIEWERTRS